MTGLVVVAAAIVLAVGVMGRAQVARRRQHRRALLAWDHVEQAAEEMARDEGIVVHVGFEWTKPQGLLGVDRSYSLRLRSELAGGDRGLWSMTGHWPQLRAQVEGGVRLNHFDVQLDTGGLTVTDEYPEGVGRNQLMSRFNQAASAARAAAEVVREAPSILAGWLTEEEAEEDPARATWAVRALREHYPGHPVTRQALRPDDPSTPLIVRCELARLDGDQPRLRSLLLGPGGEDAAERHWLNVLRDAGDSAEDTALRRRAVTHPSEAVVRSGLVAMEQRGRTPDIPALADALAQSDSEPVQLLLITALGKLEDPAAVAALQAVSRRDVSDAVREMAGWALKACGALDQIGGLQIVGLAQGEAGDLSVATDSAGDLELTPED